MINGINHVTFSVRNLEDSFKFYVEILNFRPLMKSEHIAYFLAGDLWICIEQDPEIRKSSLPEYTHTAFSVEQSFFSEISQKIKEIGCTIWKENKSEGDSLYFLDPNGHKLEIHVGNWQSRIASMKEQPWKSKVEFFDQTEIYSRELVETYWRLLSEQKWELIVPIFHSDFVAIWPQSKERIVGAQNFIAVNQNYPGNHKVKVIHIAEAKDCVLSTVWIEADTGQKTFANSIFKFKEQKIVSIEEYWAEPYAAPEWRKQYVEIY